MTASLAPARVVTRAKSTRAPMTRRASRGPQETSIDSPTDQPWARASSGVTAIQPGWVNASDAFSRPSSFRLSREAGERRSMPITSKSSESEPLTATSSR